MANLVSFMISRYYQRRPIYQALVELEQPLLPAPEILLPNPARAATGDISIEEPILVASTIENVRRVDARNRKKPVRRLKAETI